MIVTEKELLLADGLGPSRPKLYRAATRVAAPQPVAMALAILLLVGQAQAVTIDTVPVGNAGNAADTTGFGAVAYDYRIGTYEVTNAQYAEFLNAKAASDPLGLFNAQMASDGNSGIQRSGASGSYTYTSKPNMGDKPVNFVTWYDAIRFANWLNNGQGNGDTEMGAYTLLGGTAVPSNASSITRNAGATWFLPSENEWYKAAYHQPAAQGGDADNYWLYPTASNTAPALATANSAGEISNPGANIANYDGGTGLAGPLTTVGSAGPLSASYYGTRDQGGNVWEWNDTTIAGGSFRGLRGGWFLSSESGLQSGPARGFIGSLAVPAGMNSGVGFRVASIAAVPEPSTLALAVAGIAGAGLILRKRRQGAQAGRAAHSRRWQHLGLTGLITVLSLSIPQLAEADIAYTITDLGTLGGTYSSAIGINNSGQVVGAGTAPNGQNHAFLLTPVPEPSTLVLAAVGVLGTILIIRKRRRGVPSRFRVLATRRLIVVFLGLSAGLSISSSQVAAGDISYTITDLGTLGGSTSLGRALNSAGKVVGESQIPGNLARHAILYDGALHDLGTLGGSVSVAFDINAFGQVVGYADISGNHGQHAFMYDGTMHDLGTLGGTISRATSINDSGLIAGTSYVNTVDTHAFLYDGTIHDLGTLGGSFSSGNGINSAGHVTGGSAVSDNGAVHAFLYDGTMHDLGALDGLPTYGWAINDAGLVIGYAYTDDGQRAFLYDGTFHDLGTFGGPFTEARGINSNGQIVGWSTRFAGDLGRAFLYSAGSMVDLNTLIDPASGWQLRMAQAINDTGQITGSGVIDGQLHAYLLTPVPEPPSLALAAIGMLGLFALRKRRRGAH